MITKKNLKEELTLDSRCKNYLSNLQTALQNKASQRRCKKSRKSRKSKRTAVCCSVALDEEVASGNDCSC